ncbi:MAG: hypothetical protein A3B96_00300 [Candidatus Spechtbacteria bacterium RIFCSPHIGHO2_02_FULL_43_15b]|uniref:Uncharacterized protein n=1 Tax=Candidatus Spechtbacteria bacterium RIFCSPHIGHO2_01_FULL_43_30 TaxID=1802158 RepID=A0A1G2H5P2_9BACT|nr:MAG: hypothetical protein A2827_03060 [Candidatus Spechtbacteria bacterium RIFCSPHIGHO2_01_FULL_43_30]OGZ59185.1 MAG: hypothetical protein A3B96_00300 [Candidatus Spechtbacteria bacterium RIFCSPHIGHO2_02_FULL_43_15b]
MNFWNSTRFFCRQFWYVVFENMWYCRPEGIRVCFIIFLMLLNLLALTQVHTSFGIASFKGIAIIAGVLLSTFVFLPAIFYLGEVKHLDQRRMQKSKSR